MPYKVKTHCAKQFTVLCSKKLSKQLTLALEEETDKSSSSVGAIDDS